MAIPIILKNTTMMRIQLLLTLGTVLFFTSCEKAGTKIRPNVIIIYTDDIGYGDIGVYGAELIPTPNIDRLAKEGIMFTDAHCAASTCSPSRYALLTGEMGFRKNVGIQPVNAAAIIDTSQFTLGKLFQTAGYQTAIIGKWHLGLGNGDVNWNEAVKPGPLEFGFDYSFIIPSSNDRSPFVYLENHHVYNLDPNDPLTVSRYPIPDSVPGTAYPDVVNNPESVTVYEGDQQHSGTVINGVGRIGYMKGGKSALWKDTNMAMDLIDKAGEYIERNKDNPFFLFLSTNDIHAPRLPNPKFKGATTLGYRGDNVVQLDWTVGQISKLLTQHGLDENTIIIFSSDNGPVYIDGGYQDGSGEGGHQAAGIYRGGKYTIYEGGTRVPFIVWWPSKIKPMTSDALVTQVDLLASFADFLEVPLPANAGPDSRNYWNTFMGKNDVGAKMILEQVNDSSQLALRKGQIKYIHKLDGDDELYNLEIDAEEKNNIIHDFPQLAKELLDDLLFLRENHLTTYK
ncbi:MAG: arylsulfatase [Cyclobacteriaceae bacterium]|nr:arylsulfatase [Cyclobacteriaceae bacterium]